jgi:hypothetical protein
MCGGSACVFGRIYERDCVELAKPNKPTKTGKKLVGQITARAYTGLRIVCVPTPQMERGCNKCESGGGMLRMAIA